MEEDVDKYRLELHDMEIKELKISERENGKSHIVLENGIAVVLSTLKAQNKVYDKLQADVDLIKLKPGQNYDKFIWIGIMVVFTLIANILVGIYFKRGGV